MHQRRVWNSRPHSAARENRTAAAAAAVLLYLWQHVCITQQQRAPALQIAGPIKNNCRVGSQSHTTRTNYRTRVMLLPALLVGGKHLECCSQLVVACTAHCSCAVCSLWCHWATYMIPKKS